MKVSLIVAVYLDVEAVYLIFKSLKNQTYKNFEVIVAEDGESQVMLEAIESAKNEFSFEIIHLRQEDTGVRKSCSQNNGIKKSSGEYLIFIDGDCLLYSTFIQNHVALAQEKKIVTGRRVNVGPKYSLQLRNEEITSEWLEKNFLRKYFDIKEDAKLERHSEEGFRITPHGLIHKLMKRLRKKEFPLLGCNMSCYKSAMIEINGFDEALGNSAWASDTDLAWRFKGLGYKIVSARYIANEFHLFHKRSESEYNRGSMDQIEKNIKEKNFRCKDGIVKDSNI